MDQNGAFRWMPMLCSNFANQTYLSCQPSAVYTSEKKKKKKEKKKPRLGRKVERLGTIIFSRANDTWSVPVLSVLFGKVSIAIGAYDPLSERNG